MLEIKDPKYKERYVVFTHIYYEVNKLIISNIAVPYRNILFCRDRTHDFADLKNQYDCTELTLYPNISVSVIGNYDDIMENVVEKNKLLDL